LPSAMRNVNGSPLAITVSICSLVITRFYSQFEK
jgi:hypothetical protein